MEKKKVWICIIVGLIAMLLMMLLLNGRLIKVIVANIFNPTYPMDDSGQWNAGDTYLQVAYGKDSAAQYLDLYVPAGQENPPLFVLVHGGGFISNDSQSKQAQWMYRYFRDQGFACASVNYRLAAEAPFPAACSDVKAAIRYLAHNAEEYGIDPERIAIWGESAGGYLASFTALTEPYAYADTLCIGESTGARFDMPSIDALVDFYGIMDFDIASDLFKEEGIPAWLVSVSNSWMKKGMDGYNSPEEYWLRKEKSEWGEFEKQDASVLYHVTKDAIPNPEMKILIVHGDADITVSHRQSVLLERKLREAGRNVTLKLVEDCGHASDKLFTDEMLSEVKQFLSEAFAG